MEKQAQNRIQFLDLGFCCRRETPEAWPCFHQHNEVEFMLIKTGQVTYRFGGGIKVLSAGDTVCFWSSVPHQITGVGKNTFIEWLTTPLGLFLQWQMPEHFTAKVMQGCMLVVQDPKLAMRAPFEQWEKDLKSEGESSRRIVALEAEACLRRMALKVDSDKTKASSGLGRDILPFSPASLGKIEQMNLYIAGNYRRKLRVAEIAKNASLHPNYAVSLFRSRCGIGMMDFVSRLRITHAQRLLSTTNMKMIDIASDSGFSTMSSFYEAFNRLCRKNPKRYRAENSLRKL